MKYFIITVIVLGVILGGIAFTNRKVTVENNVPKIVEKEAPVEIKEPTEEEKRLSELMKIKEQEARLEVKRDIQKEELKAKSAEYEQELATLEAEYKGYVEEKTADIEATESELASFIKATSMSKN